LVQYESQEIKTDSHADNRSYGGKNDLSIHFFQEVTIGDYILIHILKEMELGVFLFEFIAPANGVSYGLCLPNIGRISPGPMSSTPPTLTPGTNGGAHPCTNAEVSVYTSLNLCTLGLFKSCGFTSLLPLCFFLRKG